MGGILKLYELLCLASLIFIFVCRDLLYFGPELFEPRRPHQHFNFSNVYWTFFLPSAFTYFTLSITSYLTCGREHVNLVHVLGEETYR